LVKGTAPVFFPLTVLTQPTATMANAANMSRNFVFI